MFSDISINDVEKRPQKTNEGHTLQSVLDELTRRGRDVRVFVNSSTWLNVPAVLRSWKEGDDSALLVQLLKGVDDVLKQTCDADVMIVNKHLLHSSLSSLAQNASLAENVRIQVTQCLGSLESVWEGPFVLMEREEVQAVVREVEELKMQNAQHINTIIDLKTQNEELKEVRERLLQSLDEAHKADEATRKEELAGLAIRVGGQAIELTGRGITRYGNTFSHSVHQQGTSLLVSGVEGSSGMVSEI
ncbi:hypothetical protein BLNAU_6659 [Blattamonas nauphoetae]|uniref:Uncharacterized protein n=1 Tax=Blattamonas nauphoetae TaxID=2049346 RepID=A0ABQ9Y3X9_9EUKA|nr:hypothetical protein BLNAU_6659 [Blattamonas nauphoetae]